jgi:hypothetical protein
MNEVASSFCIQHSLFRISSPLMARGKKGYRARSYGGYRRTRVAPRGRMSAHSSWPVYLAAAIIVAVAAGLIWHHFK